MLTTHALITLLILFIALFFFLANRLRPDIVALTVMVALGATGVLTPQETFQGFGRSAIVTIVSIFVLAHGLYLTGASAKIGQVLSRVAGRSEARLVAVVMAAGAFLSLFMNNIAAASVLLPAISGVAHQQKVNPSRLLIPLAFGTILGGMATLFTTTNIVMSGLLREQGLPGFGIFEFAPLGIPITIAGIVYMVFIGRHLLPNQSVLEKFSVTGSNLTNVYKLEETLFRAKIPAGSILHERPIQASTLREKYQVTLVALEHNGHILLAPPPYTILYEGDVMTLQGNLEEFKKRDTIPYLEILSVPNYEEEQALETEEFVVVEALLAPRSRWLGQTLKQISFREKFGFVALAIWREGQALYHPLATIPLKFGDAVLLQGPRHRLPVLRGESALILLDENSKAQPVLRPEKMWLAITIMALAVVVGALELIPPAEAMLGGCLLMVLTNCLTADEAYSAIEWKSVFLVAGMLAMGVALTKTGVAALLATALVEKVGDGGGYLLLATLFVMTTLFTQIISGPAVVAMVGPLAIESAQQLGLNPHNFALGAVLATSMAFLTPLGHPVNILVMAPGGYTFFDYLKVGLPLTVLVFVLIFLLMPLFLPL